MKYETENYFVNYDLEMNVTANYATDIRVEECHGYHTFEDIHTDYKINSIRIRIADTFIDITDRLTDEEKELLTQNQNL